MDGLQWYPHDLGHLHIEIYRAKLSLCDIQHSWDSHVKRP